LGKSGRLGWLSRQPVTASALSHAKGAWVLPSDESMKGGMELKSEKSENLGRFDYIIVGAGSAGCVLANRLSANPNMTVLLIEAGGKDDSIWIHVPFGVVNLLGNPKYDWCYESEPEPFCNGRKISIPRGKMLGGTSSINGMVYVRGQPQDYDTWRQLGNRGWAWADVSPYFKKSENNIHRDAASHGHDGELFVEQPRVRWKILDAWRDAAAQVGIPKTDDYNAGNYEGSAYFDVTRRKGLRWSTARAFLRPVQKRPNLMVITSAHASRILFDGRRATGVQFLRGDRACTAEATREVILSAGAIGSPQLLQISGIGPPELLHKCGIEVVAELPGVGENLQDHVHPQQMFRVKNARTLNEMSHSLFWRVAMGLEFMLSRSGPLSIGPTAVTAFARSDRHQETPNIQYHIYPLTIPKLGKGTSQFPGFTASACLLRPSSRGSIRIRDSDARTKPAVRFNYLSTHEDQRTVIDCIKLTRRIANAQALADFVPVEFSPGADARSDDELLDAARQTANTVFHAAGTCKMGNDAASVVDERLRVRGLDGLRVVDASVMPNLVSGNTNAPTIMIAEKAADMIKEDALSLTGG
jgi:choline dehydrogenase